MPIGPSTQPQKTKDKNTTKIDRPNPIPINFGSRILPIIVFIVIYPANTTIASINPSWTNESNRGGITAIIDPIVGI